MLADWEDFISPDKYEESYKRLLKQVYDEHKCFTCKHYVPDEPIRDYIQECPTCDITGRAAIETCNDYERENN